MIIRSTNEAISAFWFCYWKVLQGRIHFELEVWLWRTACLISKISERNAASWFECLNWTFLSLMRKGLSWFSLVSILYVLMSFLCCASFSLHSLLLTTASETNWRRCWSEMVTLWRMWQRSLKILLIHIPVEIAYENRCWTSFSSYGHMDNSLLWQESALPHLLISFMTNAHVDSSTDCTESLIFVSVEEESFWEKLLLMIWISNETFKEGSDSS